MRSLRLSLDAEALRDNWRAIRSRSDAANVMAIVKSRAYGHGLRFAAKALCDVADGFGVVESADAAVLRKTGVVSPIMLLSGAFDEEDMTRACEMRLWLAAHSDEQIKRIVEAPSDSDLTVFVKVNTGMNRLGFSPQNAAAVMDCLARAPSVSRVGLMSHFACADSPDRDSVENALSLLRPLRQKAAMVSLGNSAALLFQGDMKDDWGRAGIALYGSSPAPALQSRDELGLRAVMTLYGEIVSVKNLRAGDAVGYGGEWQASRDTRIGIVSCGYGDGYPRSNNLWAQIGEKKAAVIGRVSMEMLALDLTDCDNANVGTEVVLWGESPNIDDIAAAAGRISYELFTAIGGRE